MQRILTVCALISLAACAPLPHETRANESTSPVSSSAVAANVPAGAYTLDKSHASLIFRVNHLGFSHYTARFQRFDAQLQFDPANLAASSVTATIDPRSLELDNPPPGFTDALLGEKWLNAAQFPEMRFRSTSVEVAAANIMRIHGEFMLHGVTRPLVLEATFNGGYAGHPMDPHARIGFSAHGSLMRSEFGIAFGVPAPGSTIGVSDAVDISIEAEFNGPAWTAPSGVTSSAQ